MTESKIEWTDRSDWNPIRGCTRVSPGCGGPGLHGGCYAEGLAARFSLSAAEVESRWRADPKNAGKEPPVFKDQWGHGFAEMQSGKPRWTGKVEFQEDRLMLPLHWRKPAKIFVSSTSDIFHESLPDEAIHKLFAVMTLCPQHTFQVLTKRAERMRDYFLTETTDFSRRTYVVSQCFALNDQLGERGGEMRFSDTDCLIGHWPLPNVWLGVSCERQQEADERIPLLLQTPAAIRFVSAEPLLGPIDLTAIEAPDKVEGERWTFSALTNGDYYTQHGEPGDPTGCGDGPYREHALDWVIVGGESGHRHRPMKPAWAADILAQCKAAGVAPFMKQMAGKTPIPPELLIREFPNPLHGL